MPADFTTVKEGSMYDRMRTLASRAGVTTRELAITAGVHERTLYNLRLKTNAGRRASWSIDTLKSVSRVLAERLDLDPANVSAYLSGLTDDEPTSP
jgi:hypothetical protein